MCFQAPDLVSSCIAWLVEQIKLGWLLVTLLVLSGTAIAFGSHIHAACVK